MPTREELADYWGMLEDRCWCCGADAPCMERAHIVPRSKGGLDYAPNLMLLCPDCHTYQEMMALTTTKWYGTAELVRLTLQGDLLHALRDYVAHNKRWADRRFSGHGRKRDAPIDFRSETVDTQGTRNGEERTHGRSTDGYSKQAIIPR